TCGSEHSGEKLQERRLARAIGPQNREQPAGANLDGHARDCGVGSAGVGEGQAVATKHRGAASRRRQARPVVGTPDPRRRHLAHRTPRRTRSSTKNGTPAIAVTTPVGSSAGATATRAAVSATSRKAAPARKDPGRSKRWSLPHASRTA